MLTSVSVRPVFSSQHLLLKKIIIFIDRIENKYIQFIHCTRSLNFLVFIFIISWKKKKGILIPSHIRLCTCEVIVDCSETTNPSIFTKKINQRHVKGLDCDKVCNPLKSNSAYLFGSTSHPTIAYLNPNSLQPLDLTFFLER